MNTSRRTFLKLSGSLTIGFTIGASLPSFSSSPYQELPESLKRHPEINAWLEVLPDGRVRIFTGKLELGQGIRTAIAQVAAEELDSTVQQVEVVLADTGRTPNEGYTAGSGSMEQSAMAVRYASAAAKAKLLQLAAEKMKLPVQELIITNGNIQSKKAGTSLNFAQVIDGRQITDKVTGLVKLKQKNEYKLVGKPVPRTDIAEMVRGEYQYVQDLRFKGMMHARVVRPASYSATLQRIDEQFIKKELGTLPTIYRNGNFVAVLSDDEYQAVKAQRILKLACSWSRTTLPVNSEIKLREYISSAPVNSEVVEEKGNAVNDNFTHQSTYFKPYMMHGSSGPSCAVAHYDKNTLTVWTHSQGVFPLRAALSGMLKIPEERIRVTGVPGSGCYGHNGADDVAADVALLAYSHPGRHVRLQWSREDEHLWEPYGSAMMMQVGARLDAAGRITGWQYDLRSDNHSTRPGGKAGNLLAARYIENPFDAPSGGYSGGAYRNSQPYYNIPNRKINAHFFKGPLRVSALRSLGAYANIFAIESFMDELADKAKKDPFEFRLMHQDDPRATAVIEKLRKMTSGVKLGDHEGFGIAFSRYKNSAAYCAAAAKVVADPATRTLRILEMWASIDAGETINPDGVINQTEGGLIQGASWTMMEEVKFDERHVTSSDWESYPIMRFNDAPTAHVEVIMHPNEEVLGAGEAAQGPAAAAIANAVYRASGKRIRELPIRPEKIFGEKA